MKMQNAAGVLFVLKEDQNRWGCTLRGSGRRKGLCVCTGGSAEVRGIEGKSSRAAC